MYFRAENLWTYIVEGGDARGVLDPVTSYLPKGHWFKPSVRKGYSDGRIRFVKYDWESKLYRFPTGLLKNVCDHLDEKNWKYSLEDNRTFEPAQQIVTELFDDKLGKISLRDYQIEALHAILEAGRGIIQISTGGGKCLGIDTSVLLFDGSVKKVQDVRINDFLMGPDSKPRRVLSVTAGYGALYRVVPVKGDSYVVNEDHILTLAMTQKRHGENKNNVIDISVRDYLSCNKTFKHCAKGFSVGVEWPERRTALDPYFLGLWLAEGCSRTQQIHTVEPEVIQYLYDYAASLGYGVSISKNSRSSCNGYRITNGHTGGYTNYVLYCLRNVLRNKHIPDEYKFTSRKARLELLAGVLEDAEMHNGSFKIFQKSERLARDIWFVARSCGFASYIKPEVKICTNTGAKGTYWGVSIVGHTSDIPMKTPRKQAPPRRQIKNPLRVGISVESIGDGDYYGFEIDGPDKRFLLGDFTVTHNTEVGSAVIASFGGRWLWLTHRLNLAHQTRTRLQERLRKPIGLLGDGVCQIEDITVAMVQTAHKVLLGPDSPAKTFLLSANGLMGDEIHHIDGGSDQWYGTISALPASWRIGLTATPKMDGQGLYLLAMTGPVVYRILSGELISRGRLVQPRIWFCQIREPEIPKKPKLDWSQVYRQGVVFNNFRNRAVATIARQFASEKKSTLILVKQIQHGKQVQLFLDQLGVRHDWIAGSVDMATRGNILQRLWDGRLDAVVAVAETLGEGSDLPPLRAIINATGQRGGGDASEGDSGRVTIQILGRGLRTYPGKTYCDYVDFSDLTHKSLADASKDRVATLEAEGYANYIRYWHDYEPERTLDQHAVR